MFYYFLYLASILSFPLRKLPLLILCTCVTEASPNLSIKVGVWPGSKLTSIFRDRHMTYLAMRVRTRTFVGTLGKCSLFSCSIRWTEWVLGVTDCILPVLRMTEPEKWHRHIWKLSREMGRDWVLMTMFEALNSPITELPSDFANKILFGLNKLVTVTNDWKGPNQYKKRTERNWEHLGKEGWRTGQENNYQVFREKWKLSCRVLAFLPSLAREPKTRLTLHQVKPIAVVSEFDKDITGFY